MNILKKLTHIYFSFLTLLIVSFLTMISISSVAQVSSEIETQLSTGKMKSRAKHAMETGDVYTALFYYEAVVQKDTNDLDAYYKMAEAHRLSRNYIKGAEAYEYVYTKAPASYPYALYYQALMQKMTGNYEEAKANFILFKKETGNLGDRSFKSLINKDIAGCDSGMIYKAFPDNTIVTNAGNSVNHPHTEFSPFQIDSKTLLFGTLRMDTMQYYDVRYDHYETQPVRQVYKAENVNGKWVEKGAYDVFNDPSMDMGNFVYSPYSGRYYFTKCSRDIHGHVICKIYVTEKMNGKWLDPVALPSPVNIEGYSSTQPAIMIDTTTTVTPVSSTPVKKAATNKPPSKTPAKAQTAAAKIEYLYFSSNRPDGKGDFDIWYTYYNPAKKTWAEPVNFSIANTSEIECTPFFHVPTQTFYFSSNGQTSAGGLDIYKIEKDGKRYTKPQNVSFPLNSPQDELGFMLSDNGQTGFLVSNRPGGTPYFHSTCCDDIYAFEIFPPKPFVCTLNLSVEEPDTANCKGKVLKVLSYDLKTKTSSSNSVVLEDCNYKLPMEKNHRYALSIDAVGYQKDTLVVETREMASEDVLEKKIVLKPTVLETKPADLISAKPIEGSVFVLKDVQYEVDKSDLTEEAKKVLDDVLIPFLKLHPTDKLLISSHTDDQGSHKYNIDLSNRRANTVLQYLISKGINANILESKGYGETKPITSNENADGTPNELGRSINRRTEFLLLKQ